MSSLLGQQKMAALAEFHSREIVQPAGNGNGSVPPNSRSWLTIAVFGPQREVRLQDINQRHADRAAQRSGTAAIQQFFNLVPNLSFVLVRLLGPCGCHAV